MKNSCLNNSIETLGLDNDITNILLKNNINTINDLWCLSRKELKKMMLSDNKINNITIKMQLLGIDLNKKVYHDK